MRSSSRQWTGSVVAAAIVVLAGLASSATALVITGGPTYTLPGGGSCTVTGDPAIGSAATVNCTGVSLASHSNVYFGIKNNTTALGNVLDDNGPTGGENWNFSSGTGSSIAYTAATTVNNVLGSATQAASTRLTVTRTAGTASIVSTGGNPANNGNSDISSLFKLTSGSSYTFSVLVEANTGGSGFGTTNTRYDAVTTPVGATQADHSSVDLGFYYSDCGDGVTDSPEQCDEAGQNGAASSCCTATCTFRTGGATCRAASDTCDATETCSGSSGACPSDVFLPAGSLCRTGSGDSCDLTETCTGSSAACPTDDAPVNFGTVCNAGSGDSCDPDETCTGIPGATCPADTITSAGTTCRTGSGDSCDVDETCTGVADATCPADDAPGNSGATCRVGSGDSCDVDETCTGTPGAACPADDAAGNAGNVCNPGSGDSCDPDETCTGTPGATCPADTITSAGTTCRVGSGDSCDVDETCTGVADATCPADDAPGNSGATCRVGSGDSCDVDETCTGTPGAACPADDAAGNAGNVCNPGSGDSCDPDETCTGTPGATCPADTITSAGTTCRVGSGDSCDVDETCTGVADATCPADDAPGNAGTVCNAGSGDSCDPDETCTGTPGATCPADTITAAGTTCRADAGDCDVAETCTGNADEACPVDAFEPAGTDCPNSTLCDGDEKCDGNGSCLGGPTPECNDGSACTVDTCDATLGCLNTGTPVTGCTGAFAKGLLIVNEKKAGKEKVLAKFIKGPALSQTDFGDPLNVGGTSYDLCLFDAFGNLAGSFTIDRAGDTCDGKDCWKKLGAAPPDGKGYKFKDKALTSDGTALVLMKGGDAGKSKALVKARNKVGTMPLGIAAALFTGVPAGSAATMQLISNGEPGGFPAGTVCLSLDLDDVKKNDGVFFKGKFTAP